jgi:hypothetical protein
MVAENVARLLEREAECHLTDARALLNESGQRARHRRLLDLAIDLAARALEAGAIRSARRTLAQAYAAKAEDALHGAGQLSLGAQRAPTRAACDDGWERVAEIVAVAAASAREAAAVALEAERDSPGSTVTRAAQLAAKKAETAAVSARRIVETRNHAYTFHADSGYSFGEGWYLAAAGVLAGVSIQIEPGKDGTLQAEHFLREAGLSAQLVPYRPRPRAMKHVTEIVGQAFRADPSSAQRRLRAAFLGEASVADGVSDWIDRRLAEQPGGKKVLLWIRDGVHHPDRNTRLEELRELVARVERAGLVPVLTGDAIREGLVPERVIDLILFWKAPVFRQIDTRRAQLQFFEHLARRHGLVGQLGVTTAGMDGPALLGLPTLYLTDAPNVRMREWVGAVPGYREVVRDGAELELIGRVLSEWSGRG